MDRRSTATDGYRLRRSTRVWYGSGELFNSTTAVLILTLYLKFLTDVAGLTPLIAGLCIVVGQIWDGVSDPIAGRLSDRASSPLGRRRVFFLFFAVPAGLAFCAMWVLLGEVSVYAKFLYYSLAYIAFQSVSSALTVPHQALGAELTPDYNERTSLVSYRMAFSFGGSILAGVLPFPLKNAAAKWLGADVSDVVVAGVFGALYITLWLLLFFKMPDPPLQESHEDEPLWSTLRGALRGRAFRLLLGMYLCAFLALDVLSAAAKFYVDVYLGRPSLMPVVMGTMLTTALVTLPFYVRWSFARSRRAVFCTGCGLWLIGCLLIAALPRQVSTPWLVASLLLVGAGMASAFVIPWVALAEVVDLDRFVSGRRREGTFAGVMTFLRKLSTTFALMLISASMDRTGYVVGLGGENVPQPQSVVLATRLCISVVPSLALAGAIFFGLRYPMTRAAHGLLRRGLSSEGTLPLSPSEQEELSQLVHKMWRKP
ncbi:MAG: MFS transporter [Myxococcota bacterium]|jgi:Na+/melibiose symporter-like transporter|nr:MFS transporter [Myxococcota bacterium]